MCDEREVFRAVRLLMVDDDAMVRGALRRTLARMSEVTIEEFEGGEQAVARAAQRDLPSFDAALIDVRMPGMNGITLARKLRTLVPGLRIAFVTGTPGDLEADEARRVVPYAVIAKPWSPRELLEFVVGH